MSIKKVEQIAKDIKTLSKLVREMTQALKQTKLELYSELDMAFHHQVADATHNRYMVHMFVTIRGLMEQFIRETFTVLPGLLDRSLGFHNLIWEGIRDRDVKKVKIDEAICTGCGVCADICPESAIIREVNQ